MTMDITKGLEARYEVRKINDLEGKHNDCPYFVLDPIHDLMAREALKYYMGLARKMGYVILANDLSKLLWRTAIAHEKAMRQK